MVGRPHRWESDRGGRERLLAAAAKVFAAKGYAGATVREILHEARVTAPVLYYHFGSKQGLFVGLIREGVESLEAETAEVLATAATPGEQVRAFCRFHIEAKRRLASLRWVAEAVMSGPHEEAPHSDLKKLFAELVERLAALVSTAVASGEFHRCDPTAAALALLGAAEMTVRARLIERRLPPLADGEYGVLGVVLDGLRSSAGAAERLRRRNSRGLEEKGNAHEA